MDERRIQAYMELIEQLMWCDSEEALAILQQQRQSVDAGLLEAIGLEIEHLHHRGNAKAVRRLEQLQQIVADWIAQNSNVVVSSTVTDPLRNDSEQFLYEVLQLVLASRGDAQQVYPFLSQHQEQLNETLLQTLPQTTEDFLAASPDFVAKSRLSKSLLIFGFLIKYFPVKQHGLNIELGITACEQALVFLNQTDYPTQDSADWAKTMNNLATTYRRRSRGIKSKNIEKAIELYQQALTIRTQEDMPEEWAETLHELADAYLERIEGVRTNNLEEAIRLCKQALVVRTREGMAEEWKETTKILADAYVERSEDDASENIEKGIQLYQQILEKTFCGYDEEIILASLGRAYLQRIKGNKSENIEGAIQHFQQALLFLSRTVMPEVRATTMAYMGNAYNLRIQGDRAENLEEAINLYEQSLTATPSDTMPIEWAETTTYLALAYSKRIRGDRVENIEKAIDLYQQALKVRTKQASPIEWARTISKLGIAYKNRLRGNREENIEQAIKIYRQALDIQKEQKLFTEWAETMLNLANAYSDRVRGDRAKNIEEAIKSYEQALAVRTQSTLSIEWVTAMNNLALIYSERVQGDRAENIEKAIQFCKQATEVTQTNMPFEWATAMNNLALIYSKRIRGDRAKNLELAIESYQSSLTIFIPEVFPHNCRRVALNLSRLYSEQNRWTEAIPIYQKALQAAEILYQNANLLDGKAAELAETADLPRRAAYAFARVEQLEQAVLTLEQGRARGLSETLDRDRSNLIQLRENHPKLFTQYQDLTQQLRNLESQQREWITSAERHSVTPEVLRTEAQQLRQALTETIEQIRQVEGYANFLAQPSFVDIQRAVRPENPLVYLVSTPSGSLALIIAQDKITELWLDDLTETNLIDLLNNIWFKAYNQSQTNHRAWLDAIEQVTHQLWELLMASLVDHLKLHQFQQATLIPTGYLSLLPLHAAWTGSFLETMRVTLRARVLQLLLQNLNTEIAAIFIFDYHLWMTDSTIPTGRCYALDEILFTYAPNARSLNAAAEIVRQTRADSILAIDEPKHRYKDREGIYRDVSPLPSSTREVQAAIATFPTPKVLPREQATREAVLAALPDIDILHCSCHGNANLQEPLKAGLAMTGDGEPAVLTLRDLLNLRLSEQGGIRLAVLSACETGLAGIELADEAISLPTGLLQAGVAGVVASLWAVSDRSTMMLLVRFYDLWRKHNLEPDAALRQAQIWLRDSTEGELADYFGFLTSTPEARTYAHPFHWAAFSYTGF